MLRHALFIAPEGVLSTFNSLEIVDYGGNARIQEEIRAIGDPDWHSQQFMPWFYLPSLRSLCIWIRSMDGIIGVGDAKSSTWQSNLHQLHTLILPQTTVNEIEFPSLLSRTTALKTFHWGIAYKRSNEKALKNGPAILQYLESISNTVEKLSLGLEYYPYSKDRILNSKDNYKLREPFKGFLKMLAFPGCAPWKFPLPSSWEWTHMPQLKSETSFQTHWKSYVSYGIY